MSSSAVHPGKSAWSPLNRAEADTPEAAIVDAAYAAIKEEE